MINLPDRRPSSGGLQLENFAAFALIGIAFVVGYPNRLRVVILIVIGSAFMLEALQLLTPDWLGRAIDALVKAAGGICWICIGYLATLLLQDKIDRIKES